MTNDPKTEQPTREQLEEDLSIPASFDGVIDAIIAGHGTDDGD